MEHCYITLKKEKEDINDRSSKCIAIWIFYEKFLTSKQKDSCFDYKQHNQENIKFWGVGLAKQMTLGYQGKLNET